MKYSSPEPLGKIVANCYDGVIIELFYIIPHEEDFTKLRRVTHCCDPRVWEAKVRGWPRVKGQPALHSE